MEENDNEDVNQYSPFKDRLPPKNIGQFQTSNNEDIVVNESDTVVYENKKHFKFLYFYEPNTIDKECFCGCDLKSCMKLIAVFLIFEFIANFLTVLKENSRREIIFSLVLSVLYLLDAIYIIKSTITYDYESVIISYHLFLIVFYLDVFFFALDIIILLIYKNIFYSSPMLFGFIGFFIFEICLMSLECYMLWVSFCYMVHVKLGHNFILEDGNIKKMMVNN